MQSYVANPRQYPRSFSHRMSPWPWRVIINHPSLWQREFCNLQNRDHRDVTRRVNEVPPRLGGQLLRRAWRHVFPRARSAVRVPGQRILATWSRALQREMNASGSRLEILASAYSSGVSGCKPASCRTWPEPSRPPEPGLADFPAWQQAGASRAAFHARVRPPLCSCGGPCQHSWRFQKPTV